MIAVKDTKSDSFLKFAPFIPTSLTNGFVIFDPFIVSVLLYQWRTKAVTSHLFTPLFIFITSHSFYDAFVIVSLTLLDYFLSHDYLSYINLFSVSLGRKTNARNVRLYYPYWQYTDLSIFRFVSLLCIRSTLRL